MKEQIIAWLDSGCDYQTGVALYETYGTSWSLKRLHRMNGPTKETMESLKYELSQLIRGMHDVPHQPAPDRPIHPVKQVTVPIVPVQVPRRRENSPEVMELTAEAISKMKIRDQLHATLGHVSDQQRAKDAAMIVNLSDEITDIYLRLDHYDKHGILPEKKEPVIRKKTDQMDPVELMNMQRNLRTYVSRYKRLMDSAKTPQKKSEHEKRMNSYQLQLDEVEKHLKK